jgi:hypothetical protein
MKRTIFALLLAAALGVGLLAACQPAEPSTYELERAAMDVEFARRMMPYRIVFRVLLGTAVLLTVAGAGWGLVRWLYHRADTVYPNHAGLYPIREGRVGGARIFHDPNRTLSGSTVYQKGYAADQLPVAVQHPVPEGLDDAQQQVTAQAQAAQAMRAAVSGAVPLNGPGPLPAQVAPERRVSRPLPEVKTLELEPSHIERLLLEDGDSAG